jgi:RNA polymerase sigma factor (TIGR02999 family)
MTSLSGEEADAGKPQDGQASGGGLESLAAVHYTELLDIARRELRRLHDAATLDTRAVLHEAFLRLVSQDKTSWEDRSQFLAAAAGTMRRVLIDHVRTRHAQKRGGGRAPVTLGDDVAGAGQGAGPSDDTLVALDDALTELARLSPRLAQVGECRYFGGMTEVETAEALQVTERTIRRDWTKARGWLQVVLKDEPCT